MDLLIKQAIDKLNNYKFFRQAVEGKEICLTEYPGFFSATVGNRILISKRAIQKVRDVIRGRYDAFPQDFCEQCCIFFLMIEAMKKVTNSYERLADKIKDGKTSEFARAAQYLEASWCVTRVNNELNIYNKKTVDKLRNYAGMILHPTDIKFKSGKSAEFYYELLIAWLNDVKNYQLHSATTTPSYFVDGVGNTSLPEEAGLSLFGIDPNQLGILDSSHGGGSMTDTPSQSSGMTLESMLNDLEAELSVDLGLDNSPLVDTGADATQSTAFGYDDGATDYSYQNIDRRYSTDEAMIAGTVGSYNKIAFIFDVSGSMEFYDYSKLTVGLKAVLNEYDSVDLFSANDRVSKYFFDVTLQNMNDCLKQLYLGGSTDMLRVSRDVIRIGRENNKRYTHIYVFTDGGTSYDDLAVFLEGNIFLYITDPRVQPPVGINFKYI